KLGLSWGTDNNGFRALVWSASRPGFKPAKRVLWNGLGEPSAADMKDVERQCRELQKQEQEWTPDGQPQPTVTKPPVTAPDPENYGIETKPRDGGDAKTKGRLHIWDIADSAEEDLDKCWHIKNLIAENETVMVIGPPGSGKSALVTDLIVSY